MMNYIKINPSNALTHCIENFYLVTGNDKTVKDVPPRLGCSMIIDLKSNALFDGYSYTAAVLGLRRRPYRLSTAGVNDRIVITFSPYGLSYFCKFPVDAINDTIIPAEDVFGNCVKDLYTTLASENNALERIQLLERFFTNHLRPIDLHDVWLMNTTERLRCGLDISDAYKTTSVGVRQLQRVFKARTGLSMNSYRKMTRYSTAMSLLKEKAFFKLSDVAYDSGYYDQSHFISHIRSLTKSNPLQQSFC